jgi:hypothetical protein
LTGVNGVISFTTVYPVSFEGLNNIHFAYPKLAADKKIDVLEIISGYSFNTAPYPNVVAQLAICKIKK